MRVPKSNLDRQRVKPTADSRYGCASNVRETNAKEAGPGNPAEETFFYPGAQTSATRSTPVKCCSDVSDSNVEQRALCLIAFADSRTDFTA
jgi:hypothetical protein